MKKILNVDHIHRGKTNWEGKAPMMVIPPAIRELLDLNDKHVRLFLKKKNVRKVSRALHPTEIIVLKCMDGRIHLPIMTETPLGIITPYRNLGARFDLAWPLFQNSIAEVVKYSTSRGRKVLVIVTYHYSRGSKHRGCAGFGYNTKAAKKYAADLVKSFNQMFKGTTLTAILVGVETDLESLVLHGAGGQTIDLSKVKFTKAAAADKLLAKLYPKMAEDVRADFQPLVEGNVRHIAKIRKSKRPIVKIHHNEKWLLLGRTFDWVHKPNQALIVGPFNPHLEEPIELAAKVLLGNIKEGRIKSEKGVVLMACARYAENGWARKMAVKKAEYLRNLALQVITERVPELIQYLHVCSAVVDIHTRKVSLVKISKKITKV